MDKKGPKIRIFHVNLDGPLNIPDLVMNLLGSDISEMISRSNGYNFGSAHYNYDTRRDSPLDFLNKIDKMSLDYLAKGSGVFIEKYGGGLKMSSVVAKMLRDETNLGVSEDRLNVYDNDTRKTIDTILPAILGDSGKLALPMPNWHFWCMDGFQKGRYAFEYFNAFDENQLVKGFKKISKKKDVKALILVNPANPLMYNISEAAAKEIDSIALRNGVEVIVDDVLRGTNPPGQRNSIGEYFTKPYVVEGFSKRFGDMPLGIFSYVLVPEDAKRTILVQDNAELIMGAKLLQAALKYSTGPAIEELKLRNAALDEGLKRYCPEVKIVRPSDSYLISLVKLPKGLVSCLLDQYASQSGMVLGHACDYFNGDHRPGSRRPSKLYDWVRVTVGNMNAEQVRLGAEALGSAIRTLNK